MHKFTLLKLHKNADKNIHIQQEHKGDIFRFFMSHRQDPLNRIHALNKGNIFDDLYLINLTSPLIS